MVPRKIHTKRLALTLLFSLGSHAALAQEPQEASFEGLSLDDILALKVSVAAKRPLTARESPGIVSVITRDEIRRSGARDFLDLLRFVPGFDFGADVENNVGLAFRGQWYEGSRILFMIDGNEFNEPLFGTINFGNHFPVEAIERVEIIRGPGSVMWGGTAELAVINVITRNAPGFQVSGVLGQTSRTYARQDGSLMANQHFDSGLRVNAVGFAGRGQRSDRTFTNFDGQSFDMKAQQLLDPAYVNMELGYNDFSARLIVDRFHTTTREQYGFPLTAKADTNFNTYIVDLNDKVQLAPRWTLLPRLTYEHSAPWQQTAEEGKDPDVGGYYQAYDNRYKGMLALNYEMSDAMRLLNGVEYAYDDARTRGDKDVASNQFFPNDPDRAHDKLSSDNMAAFSEFSWDSPWANLTAGFRVDKNKYAGWSYLPRLGLTRVFGDFHTKLLVSKAFRAPLLSHISSNTDIKPEWSLASEIEVGYKLSESVFASATLFNVDIHDPIVYKTDTVNGETLDSYKNTGRTGTRGLELELRTRHARGWATLGYAYYGALRHGEENAAYIVSGQNGAHIAFARHKVNLLASLNITRQFAFSPSLTWLGARYGYISNPNYDGTDQETKKFSPSWLGNINFTYTDLGTKGLDLSAGVFNLFNSDAKYLYNARGGYHEGLPMLSREYVARLTYAF